MSASIPVGVWPTMITPFTDQDRLDFDALRAMVEWYVEREVAGLFAVCQSSEMFFLSLQERVELARRCVEMAAGRVPVIASGHVSERIEDQLTELRAVAETGVTAVVLIGNRLAAEDESDDVWKRRCEEILRQLPESVPLGVYECPYPYKRLMTPDLVRWCNGTGRFVFLKDTCCDPEQIRVKQEAVRGTSFGIYNANAATVLETLQMGVAGYSGIMANMHPELYVWLCRNWERKPELAAELQDFLGPGSAIEGPLYPRNAKYYQQLEGLPIGLHTRRESQQLGPADQRLIEQFRAASRRLWDRYAAL